MATRLNTKNDELDDYPTPPWATRAFLDFMRSRGLIQPERQSFLEPACGRGHMAQTLREYFRVGASADVFEYGYGAVQDFLDPAYVPPDADWFITNPPYKAAERFIAKSLRHARIGVAVLVRTQFLEGGARYARLYGAGHPPLMFVQHAERVPMFRGRISATGSTATAYGWLVFTQPRHHGRVELAWIAPCRKGLESPNDYSPEFLLRKP